VLQSGAGSPSWTPAGTNQFLVTAVFQDDRVRINIENGADDVQLVHSKMKFTQTDVDTTVPNIQKLFVTNTNFLVWDSMIAGDTSFLSAIQTA
jgi:hypothetical protein